MAKEQKPRRWELSNRSSYKQARKKWMRLWLKKTWRKAHLMPLKEQA